MNKLFLVIISAVISLILNAQSGVDLTYIGNMGVLINDGEQSILIDGLHKKYKAFYQYPSNELVKKIIANKAYPAIHTLVQTHIHKDHFDANLVHLFLENNPEAILIGPPQSKEEIKKVSTEKDITSRLRAVNYKENSKDIIQHKGIQVTGFYLNHANAARHAQTENIGYLIEISGKKILHVGDTNWNEDLFAALDLAQEEIDVAILPYWLAMYEEGVEVINKYIQAKQLIATHISPFEKETVTTGIKKYFPSAILFTEIGQETQVRN